MISSPFGLGFSLYFFDLNCCYASHTDCATLKQDRTFRIVFADFRRKIAIWTLFTHINLKKKKNGAPSQEWGWIFTIRRFNIISNCNLFVVNQFNNSNGIEQSCFLLSFWKKIKIIRSARCRFYIDDRTATINMHFNNLFTRCLSDWTSVSWNFSIFLETSPLSSLTFFPIHSRLKLSNNWSIISLYAEVCIIV